MQAPNNPQSLNRYSYVMNSPLVYTDPTGNCWWGRSRNLPGCKAVRGAVAAVASTAVDVGKGVVRTYEVVVENQVRTDEVVVAVQKEAMAKVSTAVVDVAQTTGEGIAQGQVMETYGNISATEETLEFTGEKVAPAAASALDTAGLLGQGVEPGAAATLATAATALVLGPTSSLVPFVGPAVMLCLGGGCELVANEFRSLGDDAIQGAAVLESEMRYWEQTLLYWGITEF